MMNKFLILLAIIIIGSLAGGLYGIIHDQLTYTISPEYYTKFKFYQFGLMDIGNEAIVPNPRIAVSMVGFLATWWVGIPIGLMLGLIGLIHKKAEIMFNTSIKAFLITMAIAFVTGLVGLAYGEFHLSQVGVDWWLPENLIDKDNFIAVGSMHNFSYLGGIIGLVGGLVYTLNKRRKSISLN